MGKGSQPIEAKRPGICVALGGKQYTTLERIPFHWNILSNTNRQADYLFKKIKATKSPLVTSAEHQTSQFTSTARASDTGA